MNLDYTISAIECAAAMYSQGSIYNMYLLSVAEDMRECDTPILARYEIGGKYGTFALDLLDGKCR